MKTLKFGLRALCATAAAALLFTLTTATQTMAADAPYSAQDVDGQWRALPPKGRFTIVMYTNADLEQESKALSKLLDPYRGAKDFFFIQIVDLRGEIPGIARRMAEKQIRKELDIEANRAKPFYVKNGSTVDPRANLSTIVDYGGSALERFGWSDRVEMVRFVIYNAQGQPVQRIDTTSDKQAVAAAFRTAFGN